MSPEIHQIATWSPHVQLRYAALRRSRSVVTLKRRTAGDSASLEVLEGLARRFPGVGHSVARFYRERLLNRVNRMSPQFRAIPEKVRANLAAQFALQEAAAEDVLIREGQRSGALYVVVSGTALVTKTDESSNVRPLTLMVEGDVFGEISLLSEKPATATVTAKRPMILLVLPRRLFEHLVGAFPEVLDTALALWREREAHDQPLPSEERGSAGIRRRALLP